MVITPSIISCAAAPSVLGNKSLVIGPARTASPTAQGIEINILIQVALSILPLALSISLLAYWAETSGIMEVGAVLARVSGILIRVI